ncbi:MAG: MerR family transcriptional regulator [Bryobacteraceae bacterium]|nr:MerR family transcriptional regulator [Bryobacteraceae bacterium]
METAGGQLSPAVEVSIPDRLVFRIGDVSRLARVKPHVLRYWETEFPAISPKKGGTGQRVYRRKDVELILQIRHLLYDRRFTIEGARKHLADKVRPVKRKISAGSLSLFPSPESGLSLAEIKRELQSILELLD